MSNAMWKQMDKDIRTWGDKCILNNIMRGCGMNEKLDEIRARDAMRVANRLAVGRKATGVELDCAALIEMVDTEHCKRVEMRDAHEGNRKKFADMLVTRQSRIDRAVKDFDAAWQTGDYRNVVPWGIINEILGLLTAPLEVEEGTSAPEENPPVGFDDPRLPQSEDDFNAEYDMNEEGDK